MIENHAPQIELEAENGEYLEKAQAYAAAPDIAVTVADDGDDVISGGIASVSYSIGSGGGKSVGNESDYTASKVVNKEFTIPGSEIPAGETVISVTVVDHAGNHATETYTVKLLHKVELAKIVVEEALEEFIAKNGMTQEDMQRVIDSALEQAGLTEDVTVEIGDFHLTAATTGAEGSISASISITSKSGDGVNDSITAQKPIAKLPVSHTGNGGSSNTAGDNPPANTGAVSKDAEKDEKAPDTILYASAKELADILLTDDEKAQVENGTNIKFVIDVPDGLKNGDDTMSRTYAIVRVHGGVAEILEDLDDDPDTITIATDRFSAYAIVYKEEAAIKADTEPTAAEKRKIKLHSGLKAVQTGRKLQIAWGRVSGADGYDVYVQYCGKKLDAGSLHQVIGGKKTTLTVNTINGKRLDTTKDYKLYVAAWQWKNGKKTVLAKTLAIHLAGKDSAKYTNVKSIQIGKASYTLNAGESVTLAPKAVRVDKKKEQLSEKHAKEFRYLSSNQKVAAVTVDGKVKAKGAGSCTIYIFARNGCQKKIAIQVKS